LNDFLTRSLEADGHADGHAVATEGITGRIPDDLEQSTGLERAELEQISKGNVVSTSFSASFF
jgi:hypothetical protein